MKLQALFNEHHDHPVAHYESACSLAKRLEQNVRPNGYTPDEEYEQLEGAELEMKIVNEYGKLRDGFPGKIWNCYNKPRNLGWKVCPPRCHGISFGHFREKYLENLRTMQCLENPDVNAGETEGDILTRHNRMENDGSFVKQNRQGLQIPHTIPVNQLGRMIRECGIVAKQNVLVPHHDDQLKKFTQRPVELQRILKLDGNTAEQLAEDFRYLDFSEKLAWEMINSIKAETYTTTQIHEWAHEARCVACWKGEDAMNYTTNSWEDIQEKVEKAAVEQEGTAQSDAILEQEPDTHPADLSRYHPITVNIYTRTWLDCQSKQFRTLYRAVYHCPHQIALSRLASFTYVLNLKGDKARVIWDLILAKREGLFRNESTTFARSVAERMKKTRRLDKARTFLTGRMAKQNFKPGVLKYLWKLYDKRQKELAKQYNS